MSKLLSKLLEHLLLPVIVVVLTPFATLIGSKFLTGHWLKFFKKIPVWSIYVFIIVMVGWFFIVLIRKYQKNVSDNHLPIIIPGPPLFGFNKIAEIKYAKVKWNILHPINPSWSYSGVDPNKIEVETPPICPECNTELKEMKNFWNKYIWSCVKCSFQTTSKLSYYIVEDDVRKIAKSEIIKNVEESRN